MKRNFLLLILLFVLACSLFAQDYAASKEKIYLHTNHHFFKPGETLFFKAYLVKGEDNTPGAISSVMQAELISPAGTVVQKSRFPVNDGYAEGSFDFPEEAPGGLYKIRAWTSWMQNEKEDQFFVKEVVLQKIIAPRILLKLDIPGKGFGPGDEVTASFSMRSLSDQPIAGQDASFTVFIGGKSVQQTVFRTTQEGKASIRFRLPASLTVNDGLLSVTVKYDGFTESVSRSIPILLNQAEIQFMPEGGSFVQGLPNRVAFKALNEFGKAADISGEIVNQAGIKVAEFRSFHFGMGLFSIRPLPGETYSARILSPAGINRLYPLPLAAGSGLLLQADRTGEKIQIRLYSTVSMKVKIRGTAKNTEYYSETIRLENGEKSVYIREKDFPAGIIRFTVFSETDLPLAERLVFLNRDRQLQVQLAFNKRLYQPREKVTLRIRTTDPAGSPVPSNLSLSVVDDKLWTMADDKQDHILSWLLLGSELKGKVEEPPFYFKQDEPKSLPALDLLMLTHGYRYFDFTAYVVKEGRLQFLPEQEHIVSGVVQNLSGEPVQAKMFILHNKPDGRALEFITGEDGQFFFSGLEPNSQYYLFAQSLNQKGKLQIRILQNGIGYNPMKAGTFSLLGSRPMSFDGVKETIIQQRKQTMEPGQIPGFRTANALQEVVVTSYGSARKKDMTGSVSVIREEDILLQTNLQNQLAGKVAGLQVHFKANNPDGNRIRIRGLTSINGNNEPLYVINGVPLDRFRLNTLNQHDIESITILKDGAATALYGQRAAWGAIIIETKKFRQERMALKFGNRYTYTTQYFTTNGTAYTPVRKFYAPSYSSVFTEERTDFRETIYWNPVIQTNKEGTAVVEFCNSDASTTFRAITEGIGFNGMPGRTEQTYAARSLLQADCKIPPYLTTGDEALLPLVIKNNGDRPGIFSILVSAPEHFKTGAYSRSVTIAADSTLRVSIPLEAVATAAGSLRIEISGENEKETIILPVQAVDKGFPVRLVMSGNRNQTHRFPVSQLIPGTMQSELRLIRNLEGQLLDGIQSMLREPHGCFEQTSSATYPNIFILQYLKETGKSNPETEKTAMDYLQQGYKRLISYETRENGFEWFGNTPAHEALTAYGLMEFTDMKAFLPVDERMLERTKKFLLSRRDGKGSFEIRKRGYDQFASVPEDIAGLYIVYALTEAGAGKEIETEYRFAVAKALLSGDAYQLSLMALAAANRKDRNTYLQLMDAVHRLPEKTKAVTTVVNSREASLRVETKALLAMAYLRAEKPEPGPAAELLGQILTEKSYYGYGSTQATVLALKAITEYSRLAGKVAENTVVQFTLNEETVGNYAGTNSLLQTGQNTFTVQYGDSTKTLPYNLSINYSTYTPPTHDKAELELQTRLTGSQIRTGEIVRMDITVHNKANRLQPMAVAKIGIPAGLSWQPWQLKELVEKNKVAYYEIFDNYLVFYWMGFAPGETKTIGLDLKAEIPGRYKAKAGTVYLYYMPEFKFWVEGLEAVVDL